jgi:hypothetical protein
MNTLEVMQQVRDEFNFNVVKLPLKGPDNAATPHYGLFRDDDGVCVGSAVRARYTPHSTDDVCVLTEAAIEAFGDTTVECYWNNGHKVLIQPSKDERRAIYGTADNIFMRCMISAGYDGTPFRASLGMYRDACKNLSIPRLVEGTTARITHTKSLRPKMKGLIASFERVKAGWDTLANLATRMQASEVRLADFLTQVYGEPEPGSKRGETIARDRTEAIFRRVQSERIKTGRPDFDGNFNVSVWEVYNGIQGFVQHDGGMREKNPIARILKAAENQNVIKAERLA